MRLMYAPVVFAIGPEANHHITVSGASNFRWRDGGMGDLIPLLGDGLLTTDGDYHRRARQIMLPAFHRERLAASTSIMTEEAERALAAWRPGERVDLYSGGYPAQYGRYAGAIVSGSKGTAVAKAEALEAKGVRVGTNPTEVAELVKERLG